MMNLLSLSSPAYCRARLNKDLFQRKNLLFLFNKVTGDIFPLLTINGNNRVSTESNDGMDCGSHIFVLPRLLDCYICHPNLSLLSVKLKDAESSQMTIAVSVW